MEEKFTPNLKGKIEIQGEIEQENWNDRISVFFDYIEDETKTGQANITDNYVETNYAIQDHIALAPKIYRLKGYVGEVVYKRPKDYDSQAQEEFSKLTNKLRTQNKLKEIYAKGSALFPIVANYTNTAMAIGEKIYDSYKRYEKLFNIKKDNTENNSIVSEKSTRQNDCNSILFHLMDNRVPISISGLQFERNKGKNYYSQYFIQSIQSHQGNNLYISDFEVTLKEFRTVASQTTNIDSKTIKEANAIQTTDTANNGKANALKVDDTKAKEQLKSVQNTLGKAQTISNAPKHTIFNEMQTYTNKIKAELKLWDKRQNNGFLYNAYKFIGGK